MKRRFYAVCAVLAAAAFLGAIWEDNRAEVVPITSETLVLPVLIGGGDASWEGCVNEVAEEYMKEHSDVEIRIHAIPNISNTDFDKGLIVENALGNFNGVVEMRNVEKYVQVGKLASLPDDLAEKMKQVTRMEGKVYSVPRYYACQGIIYNKELFRELQLKPPRTYDEFLTICEKLKNHGIAPLTIGAGDLWHLDHWAYALFTNHVSRREPDWISRCNRGETHWTDAGPMQMLSEFRALFERGYVEENYAVTTDTETIELLTEGRAAMLCSGTWMFSQILKADPQFEIGWFFLPDQEGRSPAELNGSWEWAVTASCLENGLYDTAINFLEFFYDSRIYKTVLQRMNGFSALKEDIYYETVPVQEEIFQAIQQSGEISAPAIGIGGTPEGFGNALYMEMFRLANGEQTVLEAAENLEKEWRIRLENE